MEVFKKIVNLLNQLKQVFYSYDDEGFSTAEKEYIDRIKNANPYGIFVLIFGGIRTPICHFSNHYFDGSLLYNLDL